MFSLAVSQRQPVVLHHLSLTNQQLFHQNQQGNISASKIEVTMLFNKITEGSYPELCYILLLQSLSQDQPI